ncbi:MAG: endopeptidase La, partial [Elusimicrobiota bacterium]|nr:endopeptidase La [Elusimicrobiota bacterium]
HILAISQKKANIDDPSQKDLYTYGVLSRVTQSLKMPDGTMKVFLQGVKRAKLLKITSSEKSKFLKAQLEYPKEITDESPEMTALMRHVVEVFENYVKTGTKISVDSASMLQQLDDSSRLADTIAASAIVEIETRQEVLEILNVKTRIEKIIQILAKETEILSIEQKIHSRVKTQIESSQKEHYLNEQMKAIQQELHQKDDFTREIEELEKKIKNAKMPKDVVGVAKKELSRLSKMMPFSPESTVLRTYLDWLTALPWNMETKDILEIARVRKMLNEDHFGLKKPKERVLEYLAVCKLTKKLKGPILCFVGPPGVGKTSIAKSIARSMGRKFVRMSLGGVRDESEIRGHRKTYIASMPGRIIQSMKKAKSKNPVFLLDEIDKMGMDWRGDPAAALLEVLDPEQNREFTDHFLDVPFDISQVMFVATANTLSGIPLSLRDRMEIIEFNGYTHDEKIAIAKTYLMPRQLKEHGLKESSIVIDDKTINEIIKGYAREAGVRGLEREMATMCRRSAKRIVENKIKKVNVTSANLTDFLGIPKYAREKLSPNGIGISTGLAWTEQGGELLTIESLAYPGKGEVVLTGRLGNVMKESVQTAFSYVKSLEFTPYSYIQKHNFHIHIPEGAVPKDGPSAGITVATALASLLSKRPVRKDIAMTGEMTLTGKVLPIGGLKEKIIASYREDILTAIYPKANEKDLEEIPEEIRKKMSLIPVSSIQEVFNLVLPTKQTTRVNKRQMSKKEEIGI